MMAMMQTWMKQTQELLAANAAAQTPARKKRTLKQREGSPIAFAISDNQDSPPPPPSLAELSEPELPVSSGSEDYHPHGLAGSRAVFRARARTMKQREEIELRARDSASKKKKVKKRTKKNTVPDSVRRGTYWGARKPKSNKIGNMGSKQQSSRSLSTSDLHQKSAQAKHSPSDKYGVSQRLSRSRPPRHQTETTTATKTMKTKFGSVGVKKNVAATVDVRKGRRESQSTRRGTYWGAGKPGNGTNEVVRGMSKAKNIGKGKSKSASKSKAKAGKLAQKSKASVKQKFKRGRERLQQSIGMGGDVSRELLMEKRISGQEQYRQGDEYLRDVGVDPRPSTSQSGVRPRPSAGLAQQQQQQQQHQQQRWQQKEVLRNNNPLQWEWAEEAREAVTPARTPNMRAEELDFNALVFSSVQNTYDNDHVRNLGFGDAEEGETNAVERADVAFADAEARARHFDREDDNDHNISRKERRQGDVFEGGVSDGAVARRNAARGQGEQQQGVKFALTDARSIDMEGEVDAAVLKRLGFAPGSSSGDRDRSRQLLQSRSRLQSASGGRPLSPVDERLSSPSRGVRLHHFRGDDFDHHGSTSGEGREQDERYGEEPKVMGDPNLQEESQIPSYLKVDHSDTARFLISAEAKARRILLQ